MRHLMTGLLLALLVLSAAVPALAQSPTPSAGQTDPAVKRMEIIVSAVVAFVVAAGGWMLQYVLWRAERQRFAQRQEREQQRFAKRQEQEQQRFAQEMELRWAQFRNRLPPEQQIIDWLRPRSPSPGEEPGEQLPGSGPYIVGPSIMDPRDFYGRRALVDEFYERVVGQQMHSLMLVGARRSGKTSFLHHIAHPDVLYARLKRHRHLVVPVYLTSQARITSAGEFYSYLIRETAAALARRDPGCPAVPDVPPEAYFSLVTSFFDGACRQGWRFVLLIDEFEGLARLSGCDEAFFDSLRALAGGRHVAWVTVSFRNPSPLCSPAGEAKTSPLFNIFRQDALHVGALAPEEAVQLVRQPAASAGHPLSEADVAFAVALAGRLPYALQVAASRLYKAQRDGHTGETAQREAATAYWGYMQGRFQRYWEVFAEEERGALRSVVQESAPTEADRKALEGLEAYGFVQRVGDGYGVLGTAFADWIRAQA